MPNCLSKDTVYPMFKQHRLNWCSTTKNLEDRFNCCITQFRVSYVFPTLAGTYFLFI